MDELRRDAIKMQYWSIFQTDIINGRLSNIQHLYETAHITNEMLVKQLDKHIPAMTDLTTSALNDIAYLLVEELSENQELVSLFDELYYKQYKDIYDGIRAASDVILKDREKGMNILGNLARKVMNYSGEGDIDDYRKNEISRSGNYRMMTLLHMRDDNLLKAKTHGDSPFTEGAINWRRRTEGASELYHNDHRILFTEEKEPVFQSKVFSRFVQKQKDALASYLNIKTEKLAEYFENVLSYDVRSEDFTFLTAPGEPGISSMATVHVIQSNYGGVQWLHTITTSNRIRRGSKGYKPDFDKIVEDYYRARVMVKYIETVNQGNAFTKIELSRGCKAETPRDDYFALMYLYNLDIVYQMFKVMREMYYRNFSWENITKQSALIRSNQIIQELRTVIVAKDRKIADLSRRLEAERAINDKKKDKQNIEEQREQNRLLDILEQKDEEITDLKTKIRSLEAFIEELNRSKEEPEETTVDIERLQQKRYLFVGHTEEDFPELNHELRRLFPNSVFMRSETDNIDQIQVDATIVFINWTSHGMYYRVKANNRIAELPIVYCKSKNIDKILMEMQSELIDQLT